MRRAYGDASGADAPRIAKPPVVVMTAEQQGSADITPQKKKAPTKPRESLSRMLPDSMSQRIVPLGCSDKKINDSWQPGQDLAAFPQPFRMLCLGPPNCGKSTLAKMVLLHADPPFDELYVIHEDFQEDGGGTTEWDDADYTAMMGEPPPLQWWDALCENDDPDGPPVRRLIVIDDLESTGVSKERQRNLATLFRYCSSHHGMSLILCFQNMFGLPTVLRKMANIVVCWKPVARNEMGLIANRVGITAPELSSLFDLAEDTYGPSNKHSICFDSSAGSPAPIRINLFQPARLDGC
jgi:hypothetical protein